MGGKLFRNFSFLSATISFFILIGIFSILFLYAQDAISEFGFDFLFNDVWEVDEDDEDLGVFGGLIPIIGTMLSTLIAMLIATPIAMGIAIFLTEMAHKSLIKPGYPIGLFGGFLGLAITQRLLLLLGLVGVLILTFGPLVRFQIPLVPGGLNWGFGTFL